MESKQNPPSVASDPVTEKAVEDALLEVDNKFPELNDTQRNKFLWYIGAVLLIIGTFSLFLSAINSYKLGKTNDATQRQNDALKAQQECLIDVVQQFTAETKARTGISADDRRALQDLVNNIRKSDNKQEVNRALTLYNKEAEANNKRRESYPVPTFSDSVCSVDYTNPTGGNKVTPGKSASSSSSATKSISVKPSSKSNKTSVSRKSTANAAPAPQPSRSVSVRTVTPSSSPQANRTTTRTVSNPQPTKIVVKSQPGKTTVKTTSAPVVGVVTSVVCPIISTSLLCP